MRFHGLRFWVWAVVICGGPSALWGQDSDLDRRIASTVRERGELESAASVEIRSTLPGETTIQWVVPNGAVVEEGDLLVRFDTAPHEERLQVARIQAAQSQAEVLAAKSRLAETEQHLAGQRRLEELRARLMKLQQEDLEEGGELDLRRRKAESEVKVGKAAVIAAEREVQAWKQEHPGEALPATMTLELVAAQESLSLAAQEARLLVRLKQREAAALELQQMTEQLESLARRSQAEREVAAARAALAAAEKRHDALTERVKTAEGHLKSCSVMAPQAGTAVHASQAGSRTTFTVEPGAVVRERQAVVRLLDLSRQQVRTLVNESRISRVRPGQSARVRLDALPNTVIAGVVESVARTPRPQSFLSGEVKEYEVVVRLENPPAAARVGMTALVEISTGGED